MEIRRLMRRSGDCLQGVITTKENFSETLTPKSGLRAGRLRETYTLSL